MPEKNHDWYNLRNAILFGFAIYLGLELARDIINVFLIFAIIALIVVTVDPLIDWGKRRGMPRGATTALLVFAFFGLLAAFVYYVFPMVGRQIRQFVDFVPIIVDTVQGWINTFRARYGAGVIPQLNLNTAYTFIQPYLGGVAQLTSSLASLGTGVVVIFVGTIYALVNPHQLLQSALRAVKPRDRDRAAGATGRLAAQIRAWAWGVVLAAVLVFALTWVALALIGLEQALLFAIIAGLLEIVPVIGPIIAAVPPIVVALIQDPITALWVLLAFVAIQQVESQLIHPLIMSHQVRLHPLTIIFWVLLMGTLYGIIGIFLAVPAAVTAGVLYDELYLCEIERRCDEAEAGRTEMQQQNEEQAREEARQIISDTEGKAEDEGESA